MKKEENTEPVELDPAVNGITRTVIGCAYTVSNSLGCGFLEKVYENALVHELVKQGLKIERQHAIQVQYDGVDVGDYIDHLGNPQVAQCLNYLKATGIRIGLLMNFGTPRVEIRRLVLQLSTVIICVHLPFSICVHLWKRT